MSQNEAANPDPTVVPQDPAETKGDIKPYQPSDSGVLRKVPNEVKTTITKTDETLIRISKLLKSTAGLGAALSTLNYSIYLAAYLHAKAPTQAAVIAYISRLIGRTPSKMAPGAISPIAPTTFLTPLGATISDTRATLRLTGLIPLYIWMKTLLSKKSGDMDPTLHRVAMLQTAGYIGFQALENVYHLVGKGVVPSHVVETRGGAAKWVAWSCRAWTVGVVTDFLRLWREAELNKDKTGQDKEDFDRKWWNEFMVAAYWTPVAIHYSMFPAGLPGMNTGIVGFLGMMAGLNNFRNQWAATA